MRYFFVSLLIFMMAAVSSKAADTLTIARHTSELRIPLSRGEIVCSIDAQMPVTGVKTLHENLSKRLTDDVALVVGAKEGTKYNVSMPALSELEVFFVKQLEEQLQTQERDQKARGLTMDILMQREYETRHIITFRIEVTYYGLDGQRHQLIDRCSLLKSNGKALQWADILSKKGKSKFCKAASRSLYSYFGVMDFSNLRNAMNEGLQTTTENNFPLPKQGPAVTQDGIYLVYRPGEIASPDRGQPLGNLRLRSVTSYLTPNAKKWLR